MDTSNSKSRDASSSEDVGISKAIAIKIARTPAAAKAPYGTTTFAIEAHK
jgi:hypothetical protein